VNDTAASDGDTNACRARNRLTAGRRPWADCHKCSVASFVLGTSSLAESTSPLCEQMLPRSRFLRTAKAVSMTHEISPGRSVRSYRSDRELPLQRYIPAAHTVPFCGIHYGVAALARSSTIQVGFVYPSAVITIPFSTTGRSSSRCLAAPIVTRSDRVPPLPSDRCPPRDRHVARTERIAVSQGTLFLFHLFLITERMPTNFRTIRCQSKCQPHPLCMSPSRK
jgi:hypothetical protein